MLNFITKLNKRATKIGNPDIYFDLKIDYYAERCNSDSKLKNLMLKIDGVDIIKGKYIRTKFGETSLNNLSTGCKVAIIMTDNPKETANLSEMGANVIRLLAEESEIIYNVCSDYVPLGLGKSSEEAYFIDGIKCKSALDACEKLCNIFDNAEN